MALESCWNARDLRCAIEEVRNQNSGVRSCRICEQGLYPKIRDRHLPGKISAGIPDSLAPELLQLLNSEFWNVELGTASSFREATHSAKAPSVRRKELLFIGVLWRNVASDRSFSAEVKIEDTLVL